MLVQSENRPRGLEEQQQTRNSDNTNTNKQKVASHGFSILALVIQRRIVNPALAVVMSTSRLMRITISCVFQRQQKFPSQQYSIILLQPHEASRFIEKSKDR
ncbi:hypothetical protein BDF21DRAFT_411352 [Thamnidium elegans]|nr:hypothetical protein BDF21DRAFT_411352 [Thamnidium elegans]